MPDRSVLLWGGVVASETVQNPRFLAHLGRTFSEVPQLSSAFVLRLRGSGEGVMARLFHAVLVTHGSSQRISSNGKGLVDGDWQGEAPTRRH